MGKRKDGERAMKKHKNIHFTGIGGSGMSALAQVHVMSGGAATGSDRTFDNNGNQALRKKLEVLGVKIFRQDGSAVTKATDLMVLSTAIESSNPEIEAAKTHNIPVIHRSEFLAGYVSLFKTIAVTGTSGKSTVAAMIFEILEYARLYPSIITGGSLIVLQERGLWGNAYKGKGRLLVIEADESDGSLLNYNPQTCVFLNITKDHKDVAALREMLGKFSSNAKNVFANADDLNLADIAKHAHTFGLISGHTRPERIDLGPFSSNFTIEGVKFHIPLVGRHNVENAAAAAAVCSHEGVDLKVCSEALSLYKGVARRFQTIGRSGGIEVIDDFAHNPAKISAILAAAHLRAKRVLAVYQPHGFYPTKFLKNEIIESFVKGLSGEDMLWMPEIYYAGGTADKSISAGDIALPIAEKGKKAYFFLNREEIIKEVAGHAVSGDLVLIMGARDPSLPDFARSILKAISDKNNKKG